MVSRKHKSIGSRPTTQYDTRRFHFLDAWNRYTDNVLGRNIIPERKVELYHTELEDFKTELGGAISINASPIWLMGA